MGHEDSRKFCRMPCPYSSLHDLARDSHPSHSIRDLPSRSQALWAYPRFLIVLPPLCLVLRCVDRCFLRLQRLRSQDRERKLGNHSFRQCLKSQPGLNHDLYQSGVLTGCCRWRSSPPLPCHISVPSSHVPQNHQASSGHEPSRRQSHHPP